MCFIIVQVRGDVCRSLRKLIATIRPEFYELMQVNREATAKAARAAISKGQKPSKTPVYKVKKDALTDVRSAAYWQLNSANTFLTYSWLMEVCACVSHLFLVCV